MRRRRHLPRILSERARHQWIALDDGLPGLIAVTCLRCEQRPRTTMESFDSGKWQANHATGCAGHRSSGRFKRGDHLDVDNAWVVFVRYKRGGEAVIREVGRGTLMTVPVSALVPTLSGRAEAEKRRLTHIQDLQRRGIL